jgi:hypothetical protein
MYIQAFYTSYTRGIYYILLIIDDPIAEMELELKTGIYSIL